MMVQVPSRDTARALSVDPAGVAQVVVDEPTGRGLTRHGLVCVTGADLGKVVYLDDGAVVLGRGAGDLVLATADVSRRHARVWAEPGAFWVEDLGSANGTFVNGVRVEGRTRLRLGDRLQLGAAVFLFVQHDELELRMQRVQRLEAMGTLAGGIAHDFNNALATIVASLDEVEAALPPDAADAHESLRAIAKATSSATALAQRLLRLARPEPMTLGLVPLIELVEHALGAARKQAPAHPIEAHVEGDLAVHGAYDALYQALVNLLLNARDASTPGAPIELRARPVTLGAAEALAHDLAAAGEYVEITVVDHGAGMDPATLARVFEPFYTTKGRGKGTGLGLTMVHGTVRGHGGAIDLRSAPGAGTTVRLWLHRLR